MSEVHHKHSLSDGRSVWIQRNKIPGVRKAQWSVVVCGAGFDAPEITQVDSESAGLELLVSILRDDVLEA